MNKLQHDAKPLSNSEVNQIIKQDYARRTSQNYQMGDFMMASEQGNELRKDTINYIQMFNEFELIEQVGEIRR